MPVYLHDTDDFSQLNKFSSVLLIPCRFCPAASMAVKTGEPYFDVLRQGLKTSSYEQLILSTKVGLENMGVKTDIFRSHLPHQFVLCMWTKRRREKLRKYAARYDALVVFGCEAAVRTVYDAVFSVNENVYQGMRNAGIMSILPRFHWPIKITIQLKSLTPYIHAEPDELPWITI